MSLPIDDANVLPNIVGNEKIPTGGRGNFVTTPDQLTGYIGSNLDQEKLNGMLVVEDFLHSSPANMTVTGFQVLNFSDAQLSAIAGAGEWKGGKLLRYGSGGATAHNLQTHGATSIAGSAPYVMQWNTGDAFQMQSIFAIPYLSSGSKQYSFGVGFAHVALTNPESPNLGAGYANAYLYTNTNTGNWHAFSSVSTSTQDTNTEISAVALTSTTAAVLIKSDGTVDFYLDGVLVANHSGSGRITNASQLNPCLSWFNIGEQGVSTDARNLYIDLFAYKLDFASRNLAWF